MFRISFIFVCLISLHGNVFAEISSSSCAVLRTATSLTNIVPEFAQLAMRFYYAPLAMNSTVHHRQKRFFARSGSNSLSASVAEQTLANTVKDVNFTNVALLILKNNETMNKIRKNIDHDAILRFILREIDYEKLFRGLWSAIEENFDFEHFLSNVINRTQVDVIHEEFFVRGTLPIWFIRTLNPNWNVQTIEQISSTIRNLTERFVKVLSKTERFDNYLFNMIIQQAITPLNHIIQGVKQDKPSTFDQLIQIIANNVNRVAMVFPI